MSNFDYAYSKLLLEEGFYTSQPNETIYGIDRKESPEWEGWKSVDICRQNPTFPQNMKDIGTLKDMADTFTKTKYWTPFNLDLITDKDLAAKLLDISYNQGGGEMMAHLNAAMKLMSWNGKKYVYTPANEITSDMAVKINGEKPLYLMNCLRILQGMRYYDLIINHPTEFFVDMNGWFNRALK